MKLFGKLKSKYSTLETMDKKLFWLAGIIYNVAAFIAAIIFCFFFKDYLMAGLCLGIIVLPVFIMILAARTHNYTVLLPALALMINMIGLPLFTIFIRNGVFFMPVIILCGIALCGLSQDRGLRYGSGLASISMNSFTLVSRMNAETIPGYEQVQLISILTFGVAGFIILFMCDVLMEENRKYVLSRKILNQYMDFNVQKELYNDGSENGILKLTGKRRAAVLFADISNFTSITEDMQPEIAAEYLNIFLSAADKCIHENGGTLDKYIGDCAMAFWIDDQQTGYGVYEACKTVMDLRRSLSELQEGIRERFGWEIVFSAGINYGDVIVGGVGSSRRTDYTVIGDTVNVAQRLQDTATAGMLCLSERTVQILGDRAETNLLPANVAIKGRSRTIPVYELIRLTQGSTRALPQEPEKDPANGMLYICGCRGSYSVTGSIFSEFGGETSCYIIKRGAHAMVIDCGTGLYRAREILSDCKKIDVLLTHVHYDHILGLLDWSVFPMDSELTIYGNFKNWEGENTIKNFLRAPFWPVDISFGNLVSIEMQKEYGLADDISARFFPASHPNEACFIALNIGQKRICVLADCETPDAMPEEYLYKSDIVIFDAMYEQNEYSKHIGWGHSSWEQGAKMAKAEDIGMLLITHHNPQFGDQKLREMESRAKEYFSVTHFVRTGDRFSL